MERPFPHSTPSAFVKPEGEYRRVIVVGAGAGGMMAAGRAAEMGAKVLLLE